MMHPARCHAGTGWCVRALVLAAAAAGSGCVGVFDLVANRTLAYRSPVGVRLDRTRYASSIARSRFDQLQPGVACLDDALAALGAPHRLRRTPREEILEYYYLYGRRSRFLLRPLFFLPYGDNATYNYHSGEAGPDVIALTFDHSGLLTHKEFRRSSPDDGAAAVLESIFVP